jgi:hypothetical protein
MRQKNYEKFFIGSKNVRQLNEIWKIETKASKKIGMFPYSGRKDFALDSQI